MVIKIHSDESGALWVLKVQMPFIINLGWVIYLVIDLFLMNTSHTIRGFEATYNKSSYAARQWKMKSQRDIRNHRVQKLSWAIDPFEDLIKSCGTSLQKSIAMQIGTTLKSIQALCPWVSLNPRSRTPYVEKAKSWGKIVISLEHCI